jgi:hypothetical protein
MKTQHDYWKESHDQVMLEMKAKQPWQWERHWTIVPRRINGRWYCREYVYRYWCLSPGGGFWRYGDEFDILKDD